MAVIPIEIRPPRMSEASVLSEVHAEAWRSTYRGMLAPVALERMIAKRGPVWWRGTIRRMPVVRIATFDDRVVGYSTAGPNRDRQLKAAGEIYELYLLPEYHGSGMGRRLFESTARALSSNRMRTFAVWVLSENDLAIEFYRRRGGTLTAETSSRFGDRPVEKLAFRFDGSKI